MKQNHPLTRHVQFVIRLLAQPLRVVRRYRHRYLRSDLIAGLTVAVVMLPQAMAYAFIAGVPARVGLYTAIVGSIVGALWGSSNQLQTGPTNAASLLVLSTLVSMEEPGTGAYLTAAALLAVVGGGFQLLMGLARLGVLVNFVSDSVVVGFTAASGILIALNQVEHLLQLPRSIEPSLWEMIPDILSHVPHMHWPSLALGLGVIFIILALQRVNRRLPGPLMGMTAAAAVVGIVGPDALGVRVVGELPRSLPPLTDVSQFDPGLAAKLLTGSLAVAAIGLVEAISVARSISNQTGQRLDSNQELVGQGLANVASGLFSGYVCCGSFTRSAVNHRAGAKTQLASVFTGLFVLVAMLVLAPLAAYVPLAALAAVLMVIAWNLVVQDEIARIWQAGGSDRIIMVLTMAATLLIPLQFAVLAGIGVSIVYYLLETSRPRVRAVKMSDDFRYFAPRPGQPSCPQLGVIEILGDLYFGAVSHIEESIEEQRQDHPRQRFLLLRMYSVENCDISGIHALESIVQTYRDLGGDVYFVHVHQRVLDLMKSSGFYEYVGEDHFLHPDRDVSYLFHRVLDPAICIYECSVRAFGPCQNLPKRLYEAEVDWPEDLEVDEVPQIEAEELWKALRGNEPPLVVDVREPREYDRAHIPEARLIPLPQLLRDSQVPRDRPVVLVCRGGRRSTRAAAVLRDRGFENVRALEGGLQAWERENLLEAVKYGQPST
ncbi:MAG: SulP family inorganic anion transporter [Anaerolineae bacterium]